MTTSPGPAQPPRGGAEIALAARGGVITFLGAACSAALGFLLSLLLARLLGAAGVGVVFQVIAAFTIALSLTRLGMDTTAVWLLPRLRLEEPGRVRSAVLVLLVPPLVVSSAVSAAWLLLGDVLLPGTPAALGEALDAAAPFLPAAATLTVALAATRAFGGVLVFNAVDNLGVPMLRVVGVVVAVTAGGGATAAVLGWAVPWVVGLLAAALYLARLLRDPRWASVGGLRPDRGLVGRVAGYAAPRTLASALEQSIIWIDVILVGAIAGSAAAGVYGAAARFVAAGVIVSTAIRIVVAPRFSALLAQRRHDDVEELYAVTARWILLFGAPVYLTLALFAPTVLDLLGPDFDDGVSSMVVLCLGTIVVLAAGNVQSLLLMSGRSGVGAANKAVVLAVNVAGNLLLVPHHGIVAAAWTWAASMLLDTVLAVWQVRRATGISLSGRSIAQVALLVAGSVALPMGVVVLVLGQGVPQLVLGVVVAGACLAAACLRARGWLRLAELAGLGRRRSAGASAPGE